jgi:hypothetical protein
LIISPDASSRPNLTILTPSFEESRVRLMTIPSRDPASYATWREEVNPYVVAAGAIPASATKGPVFVDGEMRTFVLDGLSKAAPSTPVLAAPVEIQRLRQRKSHRELEIMKCANEVGSNQGLLSAVFSPCIQKGNPFGGPGCPTKDVYWHYPVQDQLSPRARTRDRRPVKWRWSCPFWRLAPSE